MVKVKSDAEIKTNYEASTALVPQRYEAGVRGAAWKDASLDGQTLYEEQMRRSEILARRASGINKVSDETWRTQTIAKGKNIIASRMKDASGAQVSGFRPYADALRSLTLPPKTTDPMQNLVNRAGAVVDTMVKTKAAQG